MRRSLGTERCLNLKLDVQVFQTGIEGKVVSAGVAAFWLHDFSAHKSACLLHRTQKLEHRVIKHLIGAFSHHFWTEAHPVLKRGQSLDPSTLYVHQVERMRVAVRAIEAFVNLTAISLGLLQYLSLTRGATIWESYHGWLRTYSSDLPSEGVVQSVLQAAFFADRKVRSDGTLRLIMNRAREAPLE